MALSDKLAQELNNQVNKEWFSSYLYQSMAAYFESINLKGCSNWMRVQAQEEDFHAKKFFNYIASRGNRITLEAIQKPQSDWKSILDVFQNVLEHERLVTASINNLMKIAKSENDYASETFLQWFITEQVEEEENALEIVDRLKFLGDSKEGLYMLDRELATRVFTPPVSAV